MLADALEHLVGGLVPNPDDVRVRETDRGRGRTFEVRVHPDDIGKVIAFLLASDGAWITGQTIQVAGGYRL